MHYIIIFMCICDSYAHLRDVKIAYLYVPNGEKRYVRTSDDNYRNGGHKFSDLINSIKPIKRKNHDLGRIARFRNPTLTRRADYKATYSDNSSFSFETEEFKENFMAGDWLKVQVDALANANVSMGDTVNMLAARPYGVPCHDPDHVRLQGTCMLAPECTPEMRIYRGDSFCGRTEFSCCSLMENTFDLNHPIELSFESLSDEPLEYKNNKHDATARARALRRRHVRERRELRNKRKKEMKQTIRRIVKEIERALKKAYFNETTKKLKKTKQMKIYLADLKNQYKKDRLAIKDIHTIEIIKIDKVLMERFTKLSKINEKYLENDIFRDIINGKTEFLTMRSAKMLVDAYPSLNDYIKKAPRIIKNIKEDRNTWSLESDLTFD